MFPVVLLYVVVDFHITRVMGCDWVHFVRRSQLRLLYQLRMIMIDERGAVAGIRIGRGNTSTRTKRIIVPLFPATNLTWRDLGSKPGRRCGKLLTIRLRYGTELRDAERMKFHSFLLGKCNKNPRRVRDRDVKQDEMERFGLNWLRSVTNALCRPVLIIHIYYSMELKEREFLSKPMELRLLRNKQEILGGTSRLLFYTARTA
jgi:hypothetical protein